VTELSELPAVLTVSETAALLRCGRSACYAAVKAGDIPSIKVGRSIRVPRHKLEEMLGVNEQRPGGQNLGVATAGLGGGRDPED
jgi:excisionase family DNA binding protein